MAPRRRSIEHLARRILSGCGLALLMAACAPEALAETHDARAQAYSAFDEGLCESGWALLWQSAKDGSDEARSDLGRLPRTRGLRYPGPLGDSASQAYFAYVLAIHGARKGDGLALENASFMARVFAPVIGAELVTCLDEATPVTVGACVDAALAAEVLAPFEVFASAVDTLAQMPGAVEAYCVQ